MTGRAARMRTGIAGKHLMASPGPTATGSRSCVMACSGPSCGSSSLMVDRTGRLNRIARVGAAPDCGAPRALVLVVSRPDRRLLCSGWPASGPGRLPPGSWSLTGVPAEVSGIMHDFACAFARCFYLYSLSCGLSVARRELEEETGYRAGRVEQLIAFQPPGRDGRWGAFRVRGAGSGADRG